VDNIQWPKYTESREADPLEYLVSWPKFSTAWVGVIGVLEPPSAEVMSVFVLLIMLI